MMGGNVGERLQSLVERIERLEEEKRALAADIKDIYAEAKSAGFDAKTIRAVIRERAMDPADREEHLALLEVYRTALGMSGAPLSDAARRRLAPPSAPPPDAAEPRQRPAEGTKPSDAAPVEPALGSQMPEPAPAPATVEQLLTARAAGAAAAKAGRPVTGNPHPAGDPRRGAWDEGWCAAAASDGMDLPDAWRRSKAKGGDDKGAGKGS